MHLCIYVRECINKMHMSTHVLIDAYTYIVLKDSNWLGCGGRSIGALSEMRGGDRQGVGSGSHCRESISV